MLGGMVNSKSHRSEIGGESDKDASRLVRKCDTDWTQISSRRCYSFRLILRSEFMALRLLEMRLRFVARMPVALELTDFHSHGEQ